MLQKEPFTEERPWGNFRQFSSGVPVAVKIVFVRRGEALSLQTHKWRSEFWVILKGNPEVTIGQNTTQGSEGGEFVIPKNTAHRLSAPEEDVRFLELSFGKFDEGDIERLEDKYGRA